MVIDSECARLGVESEKAEKLKQLQASRVMSSQEIKDYLISVRPQMERLFEVRDNTPMKNMTLTSVGIAIAHANIKRQTGESLPLAEWM
jgi:hypothetical protein